MTSPKSRPIKIVSRKQGQENDILLVDYLARKCCPLWRRVLGVFDPNIAMRWEAAWKVKNSRTINVALSRTAKKAQAEAGEGKA